MSTAWLLCSSKLAEMVHDQLLVVQADVQTLSVKLGVKRAFWACIMLLELAYAGAIGLGALSQVTWHFLS